MPNERIAKPTARVNSRGMSNFAPPGAKGARTADWVGAGLSLPGRLRAGRSDAFDDRAPRVPNFRNVRAILGRQMEDATLVGDCTLARRPVSGSPVAQWTDSNAYATARRPV